MLHNFLISGSQWIHTSDKYCHIIIGTCQVAGCQCKLLSYHLCYKFMVLQLLQVSGEMNSLT